MTQVKVEPDDEVEPYDGSYACGFCSESVRGTVALKCSQCSSNPVHWACVAGTKYALRCATCDGETMEAWRGASGGESSGGGHGAGRSGGSGGRRAEDEQRGEGSRKRAAPDGDEGSSRGG